MFTTSVCLNKCDIKFSDVGPGAAESRHISWPLMISLPLELTARTDQRTQDGDTQNTD